MDSRNNHEMIAGTVLVVSPRAKGTIRSSQLGEAVCQYFIVVPERLPGLMTLGEQRVLDAAERNEAAMARVFSPVHPAGETFKKLCESQRDVSLRVRVWMLELFAQALENELNAKGAEPEADNGAKGRLEEVLRQMPAEDMLDLSFSELVARVGCCPRHTARLFQKTVGVSFREKQAEVRLWRARELLATTESKVVDVAFESGYQSLSLFNLMFKKRFGISPSQWRFSSGARTRTKM